MIQNKTHATISHPSDFKQKLDLQLLDEKPSSKGLWRVLHCTDAGLNAEQQC